MNVRSATLTERAEPMARLPRATLWLLLVVIPLVHLPLRLGGYVQDDHVAVESNPIVARGNLAEILSTSYWAGAHGADPSLYRPAVILSFALERRLTGGPNPLLSHAVNLLAHLAAALLLLALLQRLRVDPLASSSTALVFAIHPIHVEALASLVGRAELMATAAGLASLLLLSWSGAWFDSPAPHPRRQRTAAWAAAALLLLALGSKEVALAFPPLMLGLELLFRPRGDRGARRFWIDRAAALAPSALACTVYVVLRVRALETLASLQPAHPFDNVLVRLTGVERLATALALVPRYAGLLLYPLRLSADYAGPLIPVSRSLDAALPLAGIGLVCGVSALCLLPLRSPADPRARIFAFAALLLALPYLIVGNLLFDVGTIFAERLMYAPSVGFCLLLGTVIALIARPGPEQGASSAKLGFAVAALALSAIVVAFATLSWARCLDWQGDETLFRAAIRVRPGSARAQFIVGSLAAREGRLPEALSHFDRAVESYPDYVAAWLERGVVLGRLDRLEEAERSFRRAVEREPARATAHLNLGIALRRLARDAEAERSLRRALAWDPTLSRGWASLGHLLLARGDFARAADAYRRAIALGRDDLAGSLRRAEQKQRRTTSESGESSPSGDPSAPRGDDRRFMAPELPAARDPVPPPRAADRPRRGSPRRPRLPRRPPAARRGRASR